MAAEVKEFAGLSLSRIGDLACPSSSNRRRAAETK